MCRFAILLVLLTTLVRAADAPTLLPPIAGEVEGDLALTLLPAAPALHWTLTARAGERATTRIAELRVRGDGLQLAGELQLSAPNTGTWRVTDAQVDLARWFHVVAAKYVPSLASTTAEGALVLSGDGAIAAGRIGGRAQLALKEGVLRDNAGGYALRGVAVRGTLRGLPELLSDGPLTITIEEVTVGGVVARNATIELALAANDRVEVTRATASVFDGTVEATPFGFALNAVAVKTDLHLRGIELAQLARFLPPVLADARGKVSGRMSLAWSAAEGVVPGSGRLQIGPGSEAVLRLAPQPGFFTSKVPERLKLLPASWGAVSKWLTVNNPAYDALRDIELGRTALEINSLDVGLRPEGDPEGRTAHVVLTARPAEGNAIKSVRFEVNVKGPLADVLRMGLEHGVQVHAR